ncbi:hypothetical protein COPCOM_01647 [Coprococcus comes ATCC 27758]|uniref:Uncharacterized protein n=1 Tax=Coprococcus comes ATCC 27758 TaxID=470146 RepID=C0B923_9FIRM|nr:hypothetical protein COPCOM_01647 [Coprococcus comes ATCC 27758]
MSELTNLLLINPSIQHFAQNGKKFFDLLSYQKNVIIKEQQNCNQRRTYENVSN